MVKAYLIYKNYKNWSVLSIPLMGKLYTPLGDVPINGDYNECIKIKLIRMLGMIY